MPAVAELLQDGYSVSQGLDRNTASLTFYISGLTDSHDHQETFAALRFKVGDPYPDAFGRLEGAICNDIRISRISRDKAVAVAYFSNIKWGFPTRIIAQYDIELRKVHAPYFYKIILAGPPSPDDGGFPIGWAQHEDGIIRNRGLVRKFQYRNRSGQLSDSDAEYIARQVGKGYRFGGVPYLFSGATATVSGSGVTLIRYAFLTTASLPEIRMPGMMTIPALGPLDEYILPSEKPNAASMSIGVLKAEDNYESGEPLP